MNNREQYIRLTPIQASKRYEDGEGKPVLSPNCLAQWRFRNGRDKRKFGESEFEGPRYQKIGKKIFYLIADLDRFMQGDLEEVMPPNTN